MSSKQDARGITQQYAAVEQFLPRLQVQYMPLAEGQAFDNSLFKLFAGLVRDIKMGVSVVSLIVRSSGSSHRRSCAHAGLRSCIEPGQS